MRAIKNMDREPATQFKATVKATDRRLLLHSGNVKVDQFHFGIAYSILSLTSIRRKDI
jgi:hypothetical protein